MNLVTDYYCRREGLRRMTRDLAELPDAFALDVGCRKGELTAQLAERKRQVVGVDAVGFDEWLSPGRGVTFARADATALPFKDACFDVVVSGECLQYVSDWRAALDEFRRVLKRDGRLVITCPNGNLLTDLLNPYNLNIRLRRILDSEAGVQDDVARSPRARDVLRHDTEEWHCDSFHRRGSLVFIYSAFAIDNLQVWRRRLKRRNAHAWVTNRLLEPAIRLLFGIMRLDFRIPLGPLSFNTIYRFRRRRVG